MGFLSSYQPGQSLAGSDFLRSFQSGGIKPMESSPEAFDSGWNITTNRDRYDQPSGFTIYQPQGKGDYDTPGYVYDMNGNLTSPGFNIHHDAPSFMDTYGWMVPLAMAGGAAAMGLGGTGAGAGAAATGATTSPVLGATGALTGTPLGAAGAGAATAGGFSLPSIFNGLGGGIAKALGGSALSSIFKGSAGGSGGSGGGGGMNFGLGDIVNLAGGLNDVHQQGQAANKFMDFMNNNMNYVRNYGSEGTPEFDYLRKTLEAKDAAAGRNSQYGTRSVDLLGQLGQAKLDATSRMALGFANPYQKALGQDAGKYSGLSSALTKMLGGSGANLTQNLSSILGNLGQSGSGISNSDFIDMLNQGGMMPEGVDYNPSTMPTESDILDFLHGGGLMDELASYGVF